MRRCYNPPLPDQKTPIAEAASRLVDLRIIEAIAYLPGLFFLPLLVAPREKTGGFHSAQSLVLFAGLCAIGLASALVDLVFGGILGRMVIAGFFFRVIAWLVRYPVAIAASLYYLASVIAGAAGALAGNCTTLPLAGRYVPAVQQWLLRSGTGVTADSSGKE